MIIGKSGMREMSFGEIGSETEDFRAMQRYLDAAPKGIDASFAWTQKGGRGASVRVIDVEGDWLLTHENIFDGHMGVLAGTPTGNVDDRNHGTAVLGILAAAAEGFGIKGIAPEAKVNAVSWNPLSESWGVAGAIRAAASILSAGDIIVLF